MFKAYLDMLMEYLMRVNRFIYRPQFHFFGLQAEH